MVYPPNQDWEDWRCLCWICCGKASALTDRAHLAYIGRIEDQCEFSHWHLCGNYRALPIVDSCSAFVLRCEHYLCFFSLIVLFISGL